MSGTYRLQLLYTVDSVTTRSRSHNKRWWKQNDRRLARRRNNSYKQQAIDDHYNMLYSDIPEYYCDGGPVEYDWEEYQQNEIDTYWEEIATQEYRDSLYAEDYGPIDDFYDDYNFDHCPTINRSSDALISSLSEENLRLRDENVELQRRLDIALRSHVTLSTTVTLINKELQS